MNEPVSVPPVILQGAGVGATGVPVNEQVESLRAQPEPDTVICVPICCGEGGLKITVGIMGLTKNVAEAQSPMAQPAWPTISIVYVPETVLATVNDADTLPLVIEHE